MLPGPKPLPYSPERMEQLLDRALNWICNQENGNDLYNTLAEQLNMSDEEITDAGFDLSDHFKRFSHDEEPGMSMQ